MRLRTAATRARAVAITVTMLVACGASSAPALPAAPAAPVPPPAAAAEAREIPSTFFGLHYFFPTNPWPAVPASTYRLLGTNTDWAFIHTARGEFDWTQLDIFLGLAEVHDVDLLYTFHRTPRWASLRPNEPALDPQYGLGGAAPPRDMNDWDDFVRAIAIRNRERGGRIKYWEIWNEWDGPLDWTGDPETMVTMARRAHRIIKSIDPNAVILSPNVAGLDWGASDTDIAGGLDKFLAAGGGEYVDVITFHGYRPVPEENNSLVDAMRAVMVAHGQDTKPLWDSEGGWGNNQTLPAPDEQGGFVARSYLLRWSKGVERFYWYGWDGYDPSVPDGSNDWGTLFDPRRGGILKPGIAYQEVARWLIGATMTGACTVQGDGTTWTCELSRPGGYQAQAIWNTAGNRSIRPPGRFRQYRDLDGNRFAIPSGGDVMIGPKPILFENMTAW